MKDKAKFLIKQSLKKKMKTKWFLVANIILCLLLVALINMDNIISFFGGDFDEKTKIYVVDEVGVYESYETIFNELGKSMPEDFTNYELVKDSTSIEELKEDIKEKDDIIVNIKASDEELIEANLISYEPIETITKQLLTTSLTSIKTSLSLASFGLTEEELMKISEPITINEEFTNPDIDENAEAKDILSTGSLIIFLIPFFILVILIVQMIGAEINDEKSTRGMEIIISNVSPIIQCLLTFVYGIFGLLIRRLGAGSISLANNDFGESLKNVYETLKNTGMLDSLLQGLPIIIIIFLFSFLIYALLAGILASMTTSIEDFQQLQSPLMILIMFGYYVALMASMFEGSIFIKVVSYLPFISALVAPITFLLGQTTILDLCITLGVLVFTTYILIHYGIRIYKVGILNYSSKDLWKKVFKSLRNKE